MNKDLLVLCFIVAILFLLILTKGNDFDSDDFFDDED